jgi:hypothetical protein
MPEPPGFQSVHRSERKPFMRMVHASLPLGARSRNARLSRSDFTSDLAANDGDAIVGQLGDLALKGANVIVASEWHIQALR